MMKRMLVIPFLFAVLFSFQGNVQASILTLDAVDSGWYDTTGEHTAVNANYLTGLCGAACPSHPTEHRGFWVFDLSAVTDPITSAVLNLFNPDYNSVDASEILAIVDISTPIAQLTAGGTGLTAIFDDLGTGTTYGTAAATSADDNQTIGITLNSFAIQDLNNASGLFGFGGYLTTLQPSLVQFLFGGSSGTSLRQLRLEIQDPVTQNPPPGASSVPEPSTLVLGLAGLVLALAAHRLVPVPRKTSR